jgi:hypothetical protein
MIPDSKLDAFALADSLLNLLVGIKLIPLILCPEKAHRNSS